MLNLMDEISSTNKLNELYLLAERLMSLRTPDLDYLRSVTDNINEMSQKLISALKSEEHVDNEAVDSIINNKAEFDLRLQEWFKFISKPECPIIEPAHSSKSNKTCDSRGSSRSSVKHREALAKVKLAQIKVSQAAERAEEETRRSQLEARRSLELAVAELEVWESSSNRGGAKERYGNSNCVLRQSAPNEVLRIQQDRLDIPSTSVVAPDCLLQNSEALTKSRGSLHDPPVCTDQVESAAPTSRPTTSKTKATFAHEYVGNSSFTLLDHSTSAPLDNVDPAQQIESSRYSAHPTLSSNQQTKQHVRFAPRGPADVNFGSYPFESVVREPFNSASTFMPRFQPAANSYWQRPRTDTQNILSSNLNPSLYVPPIPAPLSAYQRDMFLPRPEFPKFNGNPLEFTTFQINFQQHFEPKVADRKMLFCYLLQHCESNVKTKIQHFSTKGEAAYRLAMDRLKREYGQPYVIGDACEQQLKAAKPVKSNDPQGLKSFSDLLEKSLVILEEIRYLGSLSSLDTMTQLVGKLPFDLRRRWVKESAAIAGHTGQIADFPYFVSFVAKMSEEYNSLYGRRVFGTPNSRAHPAHSVTTRSSDPRKPTASSYSVKTSSNSSQSQGPLQSQLGACFYCKDTAHKLLECPTFKSAPLGKRSEFVKANKLCYKCLSSRHRTPVCSKTNNCTVEGCTGSFHHTLLHPQKQFKPPSTSSSSSSGIATSPTQTENIKACSIVNTDSTICKPLSADVYLCVVPVRVFFNNRSVVTYAFLDQGSTHSFCDKKLVDALNITGTSNDIILQTLSGSKSHKSSTFPLTISPLHSTETLTLPKVFSVHDIPISPNVIPAKSKLHTLSHLKDLEFPSVEGATVTLLIGADTPEVFCTRDTRVGTRGQPIAVRTPLGWSLLGPSLSVSTSNNCQVNYVKAEETLQRQIDTLWENDFGNSMSVLDVPSSREDRMVFDLMQNSIRSIDGHYSLPLPWRSNVKLPANNLSLAQQRLASLKKRLTKDQVFHDQYTKVVETYIEKGYARKIPPDEKHTDALQWYLPHHSVINPQKPNKVRVVFDCAAKYRGLSLNDALMQGPDLVNNLAGVLLRFRQERIAITADIESMFHQVRVDTKHIHALRFLWWPGGNLSLDPEPHQMLVHLFGATSSPTCAAFSLRQTAHDYGDCFDPAIANIVYDNFYVDDCLCSVPSVADGKKLVSQLPQLLQKGGFHLTKWISNDVRVLESLSGTERSRSMLRLNFEDDSLERILGMSWNITTDQFEFNINLPSKPLTRRGILSVLSSLYDPIGFLSPVVLKPKLLLQQLCKRGLGWDDGISESDADQWNEWLCSLPSLRRFKIDRCFKPVGFGRVVSQELHHFADASMDAYGACSYLRLTDECGKVHCVLLLGKSRLAPIKTMSIPRLELSAAVLSVRLDIFLRKELRFNNGSSTFWSDSMAVLHIIRNSRKRFPVFVANRVSVIERHSDITDWKHVPSSLNPADIITRFTTVTSFLKCDRWLHGPEFLSDSEQSWPQSPTNNNELTELAPDLVMPNSESSKVGFVAKAPGIIDEIIHRHSTLIGLKKTVAWLIRCKSFLYTTKVSKVETKFDTSRLTVDELQRAEIAVIKYIQAKEFASVISNLSKNLPLKKSTPRFMLKLSPILADGILRVGGRLANAPVDYNIKHPIILPNASHFTALLIQHHHQLVGHSGMGHTWTSIRQTYWIIKGSATVRHVIGNCIFCKKRNAPVSQQLMSDLPQGRLQLQKPPFFHVGIDYFGPLLVKQGRNQVKRYGCIFTCLTTRAVHFEIAHSLTTDAFICALRRFICRRGSPDRFYSDNGTNFVGAQRILRDSIRSWNQVQIDEFLRQREIKWSFNPPAASHMGGAWERLIRSTRRILHALMKEQIVTDEILNTLLIEVESILNSRPLVPVTFDPNDDEPLTPNHLLLLRGNPTLPPGLFTERDCYARRRWAQAQYLANQFWRRFTREYLPNICYRQKWQRESRNLTNNDVVLLIDDSLPRSKWTMGRVLETFPDKSGRIRTVKVKTGNSVLLRPISKLCLILKADE